MKSSTKNALLAVVLMHLHSAWATFAVHREHGCPSPISGCRCVERDEPAKSIDLKCDQISLKTIKMLISIVDAPIRRFRIMNLDKAIKKLPNGIFNSGRPIYELIVEGTSIESIDSETFAGLRPHLIRLTISDSKITTLHRNCFESLNHIRYLDLSSNFVRKLDGDLFEGTGLRHIILDNNDIRNLDFESISGAKDSLESLSLSNNNIGVFRLESVTPLRKLKSLNLSRNGISKTLDDSLEPSSLEVLDLSWNRLKLFMSSTSGSLSNLKVLNISHNRIEVLDRFTFENLRNLEILEGGHNRLAELPDGIFANCEPMQVLRLRFNKLENVPRGAIEALSSLRVLDLSWNRIRFISNDTFVGNPALESLNLKQNLINYIADGSFRLLRNLQDLNLGWNELEDIDGGLFVVKTNVDELYPNDTRFDNIENQYFNLPVKIRRLVLSGNAIVRIDDLTFKMMTSIEELFLDRNRIDVIESGAFSNCVQLSRLQLEHNRVKVVGNIFYRHPSRMRIINMANNLLESIQKNDFKDLAQLRELSLDSNKIHRISKESFEDCTNLEQLTLTNNAISYINRGTFQSLKRLRHLNLAGNLLIDITKSAYKGLENLETLNLTSNKIMDIEPQAMQNFKKIQVLDLSANEIFVVRKFMFEGFVPLRELKLSNMALEGIEIGAFQDLLLLQDLDLSHNRFYNVQLNAVALPNLKKVSMSHNNLSSDITINDDLKYVRNDVLTIEMESCNLTRISRRMLDIAEKVEFVNLKHNRIKHAGTRIWNKLTNLQTLLLDGNRIQHFPIITDQALASVRNLSLAFNLLTKITKISSTFHNRLLFLNLSGNQIDEMNGNALEELISIRVIDLSANRLNHLSQSLFEGKGQLEVVLLDNNRFVTIPFALRGVKTISLKFASMLDNPLQTTESRFMRFAEFGTIEHMAFGNVPFVNYKSSFLAGISGIKRLTIVNVSLSKLEPSVLHEMSGLQVLDASQNQLVKLPMNVMPKMDQLQSVNFSRNNFSEIPAFSANLLSLLTLDLSWNGIRRLKASSFRNLINVQQLYLASNLIYWIEDETFDSNSELKLLDLSGNRLMRIASNLIITKLHSLSRLRLHGNPLICDCRSAKLWRALQSNKHIFEEGEHSDWNECLQMLIGKGGCTRVMFENFSVISTSVGSVTVKWNQYINARMRTTLTVEYGSSRRLSVNVTDLSNSVITHSVTALDPSISYTVCLSMTITTSSGKIVMGRRCQRVVISDGNGIGTLSFQPNTPTLVIAVVVGFAVVSSVIVFVCMLYVRARKRG